MNAKNILSLILLISFAGLLHGMNGQENAGAFFKSPPLVEQDTPQIQHPLAVSANNRRMAFADSENNVRFFSLKNGKRLRKKFPHYRMPTCATFSPDGQWLATVTDKPKKDKPEEGEDNVHLWNLKSGENIAGHRLTSIGADNPPIFSPHGGRLAFIGASESPKSIQTHMPREAFTHERHAAHYTPWLEGSGLFVNEEELVYVHEKFETVQDVHIRTWEETGLHLINVSNPATTEMTFPPRSIVHQLTQAAAKRHIVAAVVEKILGEHGVWVWDTKQEPPTEPLLGSRFTTYAALSPGADFLFAWAAGIFSLYKLDDNLTKATKRWQMPHAIPLTEKYTLQWSENGSVLGWQSGGETMLLKPSKEFRKMLGCTKKSKKNKSAESENLTDLQPN